MRVVRRVNTNMDKFVADNVDMNGVDFEDVSWGIRNVLDNKQNCQLVREQYGDNSIQMGNYRYQNYNTELGGDSDIIKLKISTF